MAGPEQKAFFTSDSLTIPDTNSCLVSHVHEYIAKVNNPQLKASLPCPESYGFASSNSLLGATDSPGSAGLIAPSHPEIADKLPEVGYSKSTTSFTALKDAENQEYNHMSADERRKYDAEKDAQAQYIIDTADWSKGGKHGAHPQKPFAPEHTKVAEAAQKRVHEVETVVRSSMSPAERQAYDREKTQYETEVAQAQRKHERQPEMPPSVQDFNKLVEGVIQAGSRG